VHPWNASGYSERLEDLDPYIDQSPMLGEVGLDYYYVKQAHRYPAQRRVFEHFLAAAARQDKVVNPGALKWLSGSPGMPSAIRTVVEVIADVRQTTHEVIEATVHANFMTLVSDDSWLPDRQRRLLTSQ